MVVLVLSFAVLVDRTKSLCELAIGGENCSTIAVAAQRLGWEEACGCDFGKTANALISWNACAKTLRSISYNL